MSKKMVSRTVNDHYKMEHTRTTTSVYKDSNNQRYTVQDKVVSRATHESSSNSRPLRLTSGSETTGLAIAGPSRDRTTYTQTSKTTYRGPGKEQYTVQNRDFHSNIQRSSYNPPQKAIGGGKSNYSNRGNGDVARYYEY